MDGCMFNLQLWQNLSTFTLQHRRPVFCCVCCVIPNISYWDNDWISSDDSAWTQSNTTMNQHFKQWTVIIFRQQFQQADIWYYRALKVKNSRGATNDTSHFGEESDRTPHIIYAFQLLIICVNSAYATVIIWIIYHMIINVYNK